MTFAQDWDATSIAMLKAAPSKKPILSHYPPSHTVDLDSEEFKSEPGARVCGPIFSNGNVEAEMIRLEGSGEDRRKLTTPAFAPFTAAGYFVAYADFLHEVPFDPFLPWVFMGEEIIMSTRFWTSGYDIFSPTTSVVGHIYKRSKVTINCSGLLCKTSPPVKWFLKLLSFFSFQCKSQNFGSQLTELSPVV